MEYDVHDFRVVSIVRDYKCSTLTINCILPNSVKEASFKISGVIFHKSLNDYEGCILFEAFECDFSYLENVFGLDYLLLEKNGGLIFNRAKSSDEIESIMKTKNIQICVYNSSYGNTGFIYFNSSICLTIAST